MTISITVLVLVNTNSITFLFTTWYLQLLESLLILVFTITVTLLQLLLVLLLFFSFSHGVLLLVFSICDSIDAVWHGCLCIVIHLIKDEWMEDTDAGHNSIFCLLPTVYLNSDSHLNSNSNSY